MVNTLGISKIARMVKMNEDLEDVLSFVGISPAQRMYNSWLRCNEKIRETAYKALESETAVVEKAKDMLKTMRPVR